LKKNQKQSQQVETYDSLVAKKNELETEMEQLQNKIKSSSKSKKQEKEDEDDLDAFMETVSKSLDNESISKLEDQYHEMEKVFFFFF